ncbi:MAG: hypothetical protein L0323_17415 [Planctomycetes bacterium]|nr:hypothetical protein [Planctomycetota bacterium]
MNPPSVGRVRLALAAFAGVTIFLLPSCSGGGAPGSEQGASGPEKEGPVEGGEEMLEHLEARAGARGAPRSRASYKVSREKGQVAKELKIEVRDAPRGVTHAITLDGVEVGRVVTDLDGEAELELTARDGNAFPASFPEPRVDSTVKIGALAELRLAKLEKVTQLEAQVSGGRLSGKVGYTVERLAGVVTREFKIKVAGAPADSVHPVRLDGVLLGELAIESDGEGKFEFNEAEGEALPSGFPEPKARSVIQVGEIFKGELHDRSSGRGG